MYSVSLIRGLGPYGLAELSSSVVFLVRRQTRHRDEGVRGTAPRATHDQWTDPSLGKHAGGEVVRTNRASARVDRDGTSGVQVRRRHLCDRARAPQYGQESREWASHPADRGHRGRRSKTAGDPTPQVSPETVSADPFNLPGRQTSPTLDRPNGPSIGSGDRRHTGPIEHQGAHLQPPPGRIRDHAVCNGQADGTISSRISTVVKRRPHAPPDIQCRASTTGRPLASQSWATAKHCGRV